MLTDLIEEEEMASSLPKAAHVMFQLMLDLLTDLNGKVADLDQEIARRAREDEVSRRLMTVPGIGPISATAIAALAPPAETFAKGRDFAAWLGLTPLQRSTGGKQKLGATSKMGERTLRRLLIIGSSAVVQQASKRGAPRGPWLEQMLARKPRMLVTVALANKMARIVWALLVNELSRPSRADFEPNAHISRFRYGDETISADISDTEIADQVRARGILGLADTWRVRMLVTEKRTANGNYKNEYKIAEVLEFIPALDRVHFVSFLTAKATLAKKLRFAVW